MLQSNKAKRISVLLIMTFSFTILSNNFGLFAQAKEAEKGSLTNLTNALREILIGLKGGLEDVLNQINEMQANKKTNETEQRNSDNNQEETKQEQPVIEDATEEIASEDETGEKSSDDDSLPLLELDEIKELVDRAGENFNDGLPETEAEISLEAFSKSKSIVEALKKDLNKMKGKIDEDSPAINGTQAFAEVYGCQFSRFSEVLMRSYDNTYGQPQKWYSSSQNRWNLKKNMIKVIPGQGTFPPVLKSVAAIDSFTTIFISEPEIAELVFRFMQKAIDKKILCGYPDFHDEQCSEVLTVAWNEHSKFWSKIRKIEDYEANREILQNYISFWRSIGNPVYLQKFIEKAEIKNYKAFKRIVKSAGKVIDKFEEKCKKMQKNADDAIAENPPANDSEIVATAPGLIGEEPKPQKFKPNKVIIVVNEGNQYSPEAYSETYIYFSYLELTFDAYDLANLYPTAKKPINEEWKKEWFRVELGFQRSGDDLLVLVPGNLTPFREAQSKSGSYYYVRRTYDLNFKVSSNKKEIFFECADDSIQVMLQNNLGKVLYNKTHSVPFTERMANGTISIPLKKFK
ncbi:MAG: hypothetical protein ACOYXC_14815 [Candidatus Rifleibacteriota bacterium]